MKTLKLFSVFLLGITFVISCSPEDPKVDLSVSFSNVLQVTKSTSATLSITLDKSKEWYPEN